MLLCTYALAPQQEVGEITACFRAVETEYTVDALEMFLSFTWR